MSEKDVSDIIQSLGKIWDAVNDLRVLIAGSYVTKEDYNKALDELKAATKGQVPGWLLIVLPIVSGVIVGLAVATFK
ncbi:MAG: hypothetical protein ACYCVD_07620 [Desulfitobacteriaceae bacterium]